MPPKSKFTEERRNECLRLLRLGLPKADAAALAGWHPATFHQHVREGHADIEAGQRSAKADFAMAVQAAEAAFKLSATAVVVNAANGRPAEYDRDGNVVRAEKPPNWQAATWMLERRFPDDYSPRREITGRDGAPIQVEVATVETLVAKVRALRPVDDPLALPQPRNGTKTNGA